MNEKPYISRLVLNNFSNYSHKVFDFDENINIIIGNNGIGKTNILEAISIFGDAKGLRNADTNELINMNNAKNNDYLFSLYIEIKNYSTEKISIVYQKDGDSFKKNILVDGKQLKKQMELNDILKINFIIPQMDMFFLETSAVRRKFLDKTINLLYINHYETVKKYEFFVKERMKILTSDIKDDKWLDIVEKKIVELGVSIASLRNEVVGILNNIFDFYDISFPVGIIKMQGDVEELLSQEKAGIVENMYLNILKSNRDLDFKTKKTNYGIHKSDLIIIHKTKDMPARLCSTGEQKLLLISLIIIRCIFSKSINKGLPILLLDEIFTHLDQKTKSMLIQELKKLNIQTFLTGLYKNEFENLYGKLINI